MASQVFNLGANPFTADTRWTGAILVDAGLVDGGGASHLREFGLSDLQSSVIMRFSASAVALPTIAGPHLIPEVEANPMAITLSEAGGNSFTLRGPTTAGNTFSDTTDPYDWQPNTAGNTEQIDELTAWINGLGSGVVTLTLDDGGALSLAEIAIPDGRALSGMASLIRVGASGDVYNTDATVITGPDPPNLGAANLNATRIYVTPNPQLRISEDGAGDIEAIFAAGGAQADYQFHIQTSPTDVLSYGSGDIDATRSTGARVLLGTNNDPLGLLDPIIALASGDRVIWFLSESAGERIQAAATSGVPTATAQVRTTVPLTERIRAAASPGAPVAAARVRTTPPPQRIQAGASSGAPTVAAQVRTFHPGIRRVRAAISTGAPTASARVRTIGPAIIQAAASTGVPTATARVRAIGPNSGRIEAAAASGVPVAAARVRLAGIPDAPRNVALAEAGHRFLDIEWLPPPEIADAPVTAYEYQIDSGGWIPIGSLATEIRIDSLTPGTDYSISIRARNALGVGTASAALTFRTLPITRPSEPLFPALEPTGGEALDLTWHKPLDAGAALSLTYEARLTDACGFSVGWEVVGADGSFAHRFKGTAIGHRYAVTMRARNAGGISELSEQVEAMPLRPEVRTIPPGAALPILGADQNGNIVDRQSLIVRLDGQDCRVTIFWQPSDESWWGSLEVPTNTPAVQGRRLPVNAGLLDRIGGVLAGNIVMRGQGEPGYTAFRDRTHEVRWEPA